MADAEILNNGRVHLRRDSLRPARRIEEVAPTQEIDKDRQQRSIRIMIMVRPDDVKLSLGRALKLAATVVNLPLNVLALSDVVEILHANMPALAGPVLAVIRPVLAVDAPASPIPGRARNFLVEAEAADDDDAASCLTQARDPGLCPPAVRVLVDVAGFEVAAEVLVGAAAGALALDAHEDGLAGVGV